MKLIDATIYGFGKWIDYSVDLSSESAICIYGENESGKSTLHKFILFMLFGLPPKQRNFYRPKTSGKMGGKLKVEDQTFGNYTIERLDEVKNGAAICYTEDGTTHDESWLNDRLQGMTYQTYQSIFSFSAIDLGNVRGMKEEDLGEVLLGIGLTGANNIYAIEKKLNKKMGALFKPFGKKPIINQQLESVAELFASVNRFKSEEVTYQNKKEEVAQLNEKIEQVQIALKNEGTHLFTIKRKLHALPVLHDYQSCQENLKTYPETINFPENGIHRLERVKERLLPLESELAAIKNNKKRYYEKINSLKIAQPEADINREAEKIVEQQQVITELKNTRKKAETTINKLRLQVHTELDQLQIGMQQSDLAVLHFPFHIENTWLQLKKDSDQLELEKDQLRQEENELKHQRNYLLNQMQELDDSLLPKAQLQSLRERVSQYKEFHVLTKVKKEAEQREQTWKKKIAKQKKNSRTGMVVAIILSLSTGMIAIFSTLAWMYVVMIAFLVTGIGQWLWSKYNINEMEEMLSNVEPHVTTLHVSNTEKEQAEQSIAIYEQNRSEHKALKEQEKTRSIQYIKWVEKKKMLVEREKRLYEQIDGQVETYPFLQHVDVAFWPEIYHRMQRLLDVNKELKNTIDQVKKLDEKLDQYESTIVRFLQKINKYQPELSWVNQLEIVYRQKKDYEAIKQQISQYKSLLKDATAHEQDIEQKMKPYKKERNDLITTAKVDTENAYYEKANQLKEKEKLGKSLDTLKVQLGSILPQYTKQPFNRDDIDEAKLKMNQQQTLDKITEMESRLESLRQQHAQLKAELTNMECSESYSESIHQYGMEKEQLNKLAKEWAVLKTAKEMLAETMRIYQDKYLNKVIEATTAYFRHLTGNAYQTVYAPIGEEPFQTETNDGIRYRVNELSQGTVDQLYISLRLAISEMMSEKHRLPFMIDDAFVHFDAVRTKRVVEIMEHIGERQQIIIFTCRKEVIDSTKNAKLFQLTDAIRINE